MVEADGGSTGSFEMTGVKVSKFHVSGCNLEPREPRLIQANPRGTRSTSQIFRGSSCAGTDGTDVTMIWLTTFCRSGSDMSRKLPHFWNRNLDQWLLFQRILQADATGV